MASGYELAQAYVQILPTTKNLGANLTKEFSSAGDTAGKAGGEKAGSGLVSGLGKAMGTVGKVAMGALTAATAATGAFAASAVSVGKEFDTAMSQVAATLGITTSDIENNVDGAGDKFDMLRAKAQEMGAATNFSASEAAEGLNILAMSGYDAQSACDMLEDVLHLSAAGAMDMASAAGYVAGAMKGFNDETKDSRYYADLMAKGATLANTSVSQLGEAMSGGAASAAAYNQSADSMTISLLRLAEQGEVGSAASTALAAAMKNLYTPTDQAKAALDELGIAAYTSDGKARDFNDIVNELSGALGNYSQEEANAYKQTIFGIQGLDAFNKMTVTGTEKQEEWAEALAAAGDGAGEAAKQYDTMTDNLAGDIDIWNSALDGFKIAISDKLMPTVRGFVQFGSDSMSSLTEAFQNNGIDGIVDAFGDILEKGIGTIAQKLPEVTRIGGKLLSTLAQAIITNAPQLINSAGTIIMQLANGLAQSMPQIMQSAQDILIMLGQGFVTYLPDLLNASITIIVGLAQGITESLPELVPIVIDIIMAITQALVDNIDLVVQAGIDLFLALVQALPEIIAALAEATLQIVNAIIDEVLSLGDEMEEIFIAAWDAVKAIWDTVVDFFVGIWNGVQEVFAPVTEWFTEKFTAAWNGIQNAFATIGSFFTEKWNSIKTTFSEVGTWFSEKFTGAMNKIKEAFSSIGTFFSARWADIKNVFNSVKTWFSNKFGDAWKAIKDKFSEWGDFWGGLWDKIKEKFSAIGTSISNAISGAVKAGLNGVLSSIENIINSGIRMINGAIKLINKIPGVNIGKISELSLPRLERGGILERGQVGFLEGTGAEAVVPLENNQKWIHSVALDMEAEFSRGSSAQMEELIDVVEDLSEKVGHLQVVMDGRTVVGSISDRMNNALGTSSAYSMRGMALA